jgi:hypothetical protein
VRHVAYNSSIQQIEKIVAESTVSQIQALNLTNTLDNFTKHSAQETLAQLCEEKWLYKNVNGTLQAGFAVASSR